MKTKLVFLALTLLFLLPSSQAMKVYESEVLSFSEPANSQEENRNPSITYFKNEALILIEAQGDYEVRVFSSFGRHHGKYYGRNSHRIYAHTSGEWLILIVKTEERRYLKFIRK